MCASPAHLVNPPADNTAPHNVSRETEAVPVGWIAYERNMMVLLEQTSPLTPEKFQELSGVSDDDIGRLEIYVGLLKKWQKNINLVSKDSLFG